MDSTGTGSDPRTDATTRVLVVVANELSRRGLALLLDVEPGLTVVGETADVEAAMTTLADARPDVVLLDARRQRTPPSVTYPALVGALPGVRLLVLSDSTDAADLHEALASGASGFVLGDATVAELADAVRAVAEGQTIITSALALALGRRPGGASHQGRAPADLGDTLSDRQVEVLRLLAHGLSNAGIAEALCISTNTVKNHVRKILDALDVHSRMEAVMHPLVREALAGEDHARERVVGGR